MDPIKEFQNEVQDNIQKLKQSNKTQELTHNWMELTARFKYTYNFSWLGRPVIQFPQDIVALQEIIWDTKPDLIIETGIAHGGSLIMNASYMAMLDYCDAYQNGGVLDPREPKRFVLGIDIDIREHNQTKIQTHPFSARIKMIEGSSIDTDIIEQVYEYANEFENIMVILDSNHTHDHVLCELEAYGKLVSNGNYCVVFDTVVEDMPDDLFNNRPWGVGNNPKTAVWEYLKTHPEFEIDKDIENKLQITVSPDGYLKKTKR